MKKVLFTSYDGLTDNLGQSQVIPYICGLAQKGYAMSVLSCEKKEALLRNKAKVQAQLNSYNIEWKYVEYTRNPPVISTLWDLIRMYTVGCSMFRSTNFNLIHSRTIISAVMGFKLKEKFKTRFVFDMRGFWADERAESGLWNLSNPVFKLIYLFFKKKERKFLNEADYVICLTQKAKTTIHSWKDIPRQPVPIEVIPCCADLELFSDKGIDTKLLPQLRQKLGLTEREFVLCYLGSLGTWYMLDEMLDFFKCLIEKLPSAKFLFITGDDKEIVIKKSVAKGIPVESLIITPANREQVPTYLALANWGIFFIQPVFSKSGSSPTKQGEIMGMGLPLICNAGVGDVDAIVADTHSGYVLKDFSTQTYYAAVEKIMSGRLDKGEIRRGAYKYYSLEKGIEQFEIVYSKCIPD